MRRPVPQSLKPVASEKPPVTRSWMSKNMKPIASAPQ